MDELLIDTVKAYPILYNHEDPNFKDYMLKENSWKEIASKLNCSVSDCKSRWQRLRERFGKEKRERESFSKSGSKVSRCAFRYYNNMSFLTDHIKRRRSLSKISMKRTKMMKVTASEPHIYVISPISSSSTNNNGQEKNPAMDSNIIVETTKSPTSKIDSQYSNVANEVPIQPCVNVLSPLEKNVPPGSGPASSPIFKNNHSISTNPSKHLLDASSYDESDESIRSLFIRQGTTRSISLSPKLSKKKDKSTKLERSLILLCQTMHKHFQDKSKVTDSTDETFAKLMVLQLEKLPRNEKQKRQQAIMQILYEPYDE